MICVCDAVPFTVFKPLPDKVFPGFTRERALNLQVRKKIALTARKRTVNEVGTKRSERSLDRPGLLERVFKLWVRRKARKWSKDGGGKSLPALDAKEAMTTFN